MSAPRLLVVGLGMLGSAVRDADWTSRFDVVAVSRRSPGAEARLDITDAAAVRAFFASQKPFAAVINCAAESNVDACETDPDSGRRTNALGVRHLAEACRQTGAALVHVSTDYVFSGRKSESYSETDGTGPCSIYGMTKLEGEYYALTLPRVSAVVRTTWIFGGERTDFVNGIVDRVRRGERPTVVDSQTASPSHAGDLADAIGRVVERFALPELAKPGARSNRIFNVTNRGATTRHAMAERIAAALGVQGGLPRASAADIPGWVAVRPVRTVLDCGRARAELDIRPRDWEEALDAHVALRVNRP